MDLSKFLYIQKTITFYNKQQDYFSYYDLEALVKTLKENENKYNNTFLFEDKKPKEEFITTSQPTNPHQKGNKNKKGNTNTTNKNKIVYNNKTMGFQILSAIFKKSIMN